MSHIFTFRTAVLNSLLINCVFWFEGTICLQEILTNFFYAKPPPLYIDLIINRDQDRNIRDIVILKGCKLYIQSFKSKSENGF